jgi:hypothetical protein
VVVVTNAGVRRQGLTELQTKLANLILGLKSDPNELDTLGGDGGAQLPPPANGTAAAVPGATGWGGSEASPAASGWGGATTAPATSGWGGASASGGGGGGGEALGGVRVQVLGHHPQQQEGGVPTQHQVRGVQEAAAGERAAAQLETPVGVAPIHRRRKAAQAGTCDTRTGSIIS